MWVLFVFYHLDMKFPLRVRSGSSATRVQTAVSPQRRPEARKQEQKPIQEYPAM